MPRRVAASQRCSVCQHPRRGAIERAYLAGKPRIQVAEEFGLSFSALNHHYERGHASRDVKEARASQNRAAGSQLLESVEEYRDKAHSLLETAEGIMSKALEGDPGLALMAIKQGLSAIRECTRLLELSGKLTGELDQSKFTLYVLPAWMETRDAILGILEEFPEARQALLEGLKARLAEKAKIALPEPDIEADIVEVEGTPVPNAD